MKYSLLEAAKEITPTNLGYPVHSAKYPYSVVLMDTEFNRTNVAISEIKQYCEQLGYQIRHVYLISCFASDLLTEDRKMDTEFNITIFHNGTEYDVFCYMGCEIL